MNSVLTYVRHDGCKLWCFFDGLKYDLIMLCYATVCLKPLLCFSSLPGDMDSASSPTRTRLLFSMIGLEQLPIRDDDINNVEPL